MVLCGGTGDEHEMSDEVKALAHQMKGAVEEKLGKKFEKFEPCSYKSQVVAGINYFIKVEADSEHVHMRVYKPLGGEAPQLSAVKGGLTHDDKLEYFEA